MKVYARTKDGYIGEIVEVGKYTLTMSINGVIRYVDIDNVKNTSPHIIELVEIGDYVDGCYIQKIFKNENGIMECLLDSDYEFSSIIKNDEIESIVTKEQFAKGEFIL